METASQLQSEVTLDIRGTKSFNQPVSTRSRWEEMVKVTVTGRPPKKHTLGHVNEGVSRSLSTEGRFTVNIGWRPGLQNKGRAS